MRPSTISRLAFPQPATALMAVVARDGVIDRMAFAEITDGELVSSCIARASADGISHTMDRVR
jgi:hypothetical protein